MLPYIILALLSIADGARILGIVPSPSYSHQVFYQPIWRELASRGHELVVITTDPINDPSLTRLKEIDIKGSYDIYNKRIMKAVLENKGSILGSILTIVDVFNDISVYQLEHPDVQNLIKNETQNFDIILMEFMSFVMFPFKHKFQCPLIGMTSMDASGLVHDIMGNARHQILYPEAIGGKPEPSFFEKIETLVTVFALHMLATWYMIPFQNELMHKYFGESYPDLTEIAKTTDMLFINVNPVFSANRPLIPSTIAIGGGLHIKELKPLPKELQEFMDDAKKGVVYFSLGSNVKSKDISNTTRDILLDVFAQIPYKVLWKFESESLPGKPDNVKIMKWTPQQDVLRHPNVKVFITQCGLQSLEEALFSKVPVVGMPFFADQEGNSRKIEPSGIGLVVNPWTMTAEVLKTTLLEVIDNPKYKERVTVLANLVKDEPMTGLEKAVWWTEYVIRHNGSQFLKGPSGLPFYQYHYLDVMAFLLAVVSSFLFILYFITKKMIGAICRLSTRSKLKIS